MKSVLTSIQPKGCELIANGSKTIEVRKTKPKIKTPFKCYIYCTLPPRSEFFWHDDREYTADNFLCKKVIGEFVCNKIENIEIRHFTVFGHENRYASVGENPDNQWLKHSCLAYDEVVAYGKLAPLYGWHISDLVIYDKPKELSDFATFCKGTGSETDKICKNCRYLCFDDNPINGYTRCRANKRKTLTRPPQSWCYVEELR